MTQRMRSGAKAKVAAMAGKATLTMESSEATKAPAAAIQRDIPKYDGTREEKEPARSPPAARPRRRGRGGIGGGGSGGVRGRHHSPARPGLGPRRQGRRARAHHHHAPG